MHILPFSKIIIPETRQRQHFDPDAMQELCDSIESIGLMHAPVVRPTEAGMILVAGERRLRAMEQIWELGGFFRYADESIPVGQVPVVSIGELDPLAAEEAELDENLKRRDLTWQEHAEALERLHNLRRAQQAASEPLVPGGPAPTHTVADTAREVRGSADGYNQDIVRKELIVARHLSDPAIAGAKDVKEAFKILKRQETTKKNQALSAALGPYFSFSSHTLIHGNCLTWMETYNGPTFDVILTDPPYGMGADSFGDAGGKLAGIEHRYSDSHESWQELIRAWAPLSYKVAAQAAHAYVFCDFDRFHELKRFMQEAGWYVFRTPIINYKTDSGRVPLPDRGPRRQYELVLYGIKGDKPTTHIYPDVIPSAADANMTHGAQKPVGVMQNLLQRSVKPGDRVLDTFAGTGPTLEAGHTMQCFVTAIEQEAEYHGMCLTRLERLKANENMDLPGL